MSGSRGLGPGPRPPTPAPFPVEGPASGKEAYGTHLGNSFCINHFFQVRHTLVLTGKDEIAFSFLPATFLWILIKHMPSLGWEIEPSLSGPFSRGGVGPGEAQL